MYVSIKIPNCMMMTWIINLFGILMHLVFFIFREQKEQQKSQDGPAPSSRSQTSESGSNARQTPPIPTDEVTPSASGKPNWAEEGGSSWGGQANAGPYQVRPT